jgi:hypothetical protein
LDAPDLVDDYYLKLIRWSEDNIIPAGTVAAGVFSILDPSTGELSEGRKNNVRIGSIKDDLVTGIYDNPNDPVHFYIVGATKRRRWYSS